LANAQRPGKETPAGQKQSNFLKDTAMVKRLNDLNTLPDKDKEYILYALDGLIKSAKLQAL